MTLRACVAAHRLEEAEAVRVGELVHGRRGRAEQAEHGDEAEDRAGHALARVALDVAWRVGESERHSRCGDFRQRNAPTV